MGKDDISKFKGEEFYTWQTKLCGYLIKKNLWAIVTTNEPSNIYPWLPTKFEDHIKLITFLSTLETKQKLTNLNCPLWGFWSDNLLMIT